jgi:hypothetical protein
MRRIAVERVKARPAWTRMMLSGRGPGAWWALLRSSRAAGESRGAKRKRAPGSRRMMNWMEELQRLQTPSKRMTGWGSGSAGYEPGVSKRH